MERDFSLYQEDENGEVLWRIAQQGADLSYEREIDFAVIFPSEEAALKFGAVALRNHVKVHVSSYEENEQFPWQVCIYPVMEPTHNNISDFESMIGTRASELGGINDGWGCGS